MNGMKIGMAKGVFNWIELENYLMKGSEHE